MKVDLFIKYRVGGQIHSEEIKDFNCIDVLKMEGMLLVHVSNGEPREFYIPDIISIELAEAII